jgi:HlyD family secretion protein
MDLRPDASHLRAAAAFKVSLAAPFKVVPATEAIEDGKRASGAAMDHPLPRSKPRYALWAVSALLVLGSVMGIWRLIPHGLRVVEEDIRVAVVQRGTFRNDIVVRASAEPLHTIMLDVLETGRVEEVLVNDGAIVDKGTLLFRLSNPQLHLNLVARQAERAQQISNLSALRVSIEASKTEHQRRLLELKFALATAERQYSRSESLVKTGVVSVAEFENARDRLEQQRLAIQDENERNTIELRTKTDGVTQMEQAVQQLDTGLKVVNDSIEALAVRAPISGRLTDFSLQLGEIVKSEQHVGRIDDPRQNKLLAPIDEYFLGSVVSGKQGMVSLGTHEYPVEVRRVFPQIKEGRFLAELVFTGNSPAEMNPGQSAQTRITLGGASEALLLPTDSFLTETGGTWAFVLSPDGRSAARRKMSVGSRNSSQVEVTAGLAAGERVVVSTYAPFGNAAHLQIVQ